MSTWTFYANPFKTTIATVTNFTNESTKQTMLHLRICILHSTWSSTLVTTIWNAGNLADGFSVWSQAAMLAQKCSGLGQLHWVSNSELRLIFEVRIKNWPKTPTTAGTNVLFIGFLWGGLIFQESKVYTVAIGFCDAPWCTVSGLALSIWFLQGFKTWMSGHRCTAGREQCLAHIYLSKQSQQALRFGAWILCRLFLKISVRIHVDLVVLL